MNKGLMTLLASFVLTGFSVSSNVLADNFNVSDSYNNINVSEIEFALREDGLGILGFDGIHDLTSPTAKKPILVTKDTNSNNSVIKFQLRHGDCGEEPNFSDCDNHRERAELVFEKEVAQKEKWYRFKIYFPSSHNPTSPANLSIIQWKRNRANITGARSSLVLVQFQQRRSGLVFNRNGGTFKHSNIVLVTEEELYNRWIEIVFNTNWHPDNKKGFMRVWVNGQQKVNAMGASHSHNGEKLNLRLGLYSSALYRFTDAFPKEKHPTREIYFDAIKGSYNCEDIFDAARCRLLKRQISLNKTKTKKYDRTVSSMKLKFKCLNDYAISNDISDLPLQTEIDMLLANLKDNKYYRSHRQIVKAGISKEAMNANKQALVRLVNFEGTNEEYCAKPVL